MSRLTDIRGDEFAKELAAVTDDGLHVSVARGGTGVFICGGGL